MRLLRTAGLVLALPLLFAAAPAAAPENAPRGDAAKGDVLSAGCVACHGPDGNSLSGAFPSIAGQGYGYLYDQLKAMRDGERVIPVMAGQLDGMSDGDLKDIAAWYSGNEARIGQASKESLELGQSLYRFGSLKRGIPACAACHGPAGQGIASARMPALSGQYSEYIAQTLKDYRSGKRKGLRFDAMQTIALKLTDEDIRVLSEFIRGLY